MQDSGMPGAGPHDPQSPPCDPKQKSPRFGAGQDPAKRDQILDGAGRVFSRMGFDAAGMADITREAGVSKGTIYVYFEGKDDLFEALVDRERQRLFRSVIGSLDGPGTMEERLRAYAFTLTTALCSNEVIQAHRIIIGISSRKPSIGATFYERGPRLGMAALAGFFESQIVAGRLRSCDTARAAQIFVELCLSGLFRQRLLAYLPEPPTKAQVEANVEAAIEVFGAAYFAAQPDTWGQVRA